MLFEVDFIRKNESIFSDKMGERICRKGIHVIDDGTLQGNRGSLNIDDEGVPAQKTYMVTDGILTSFYTIVFLPNSSIPPLQETAGGNLSVMHRYRVCELPTWKVEKIQKNPS